MINSIIVQHLKHNKRLVVPGFGAFIKKDETGEVVFVEFLKKDDGVLVSELQKRYSLDRNEAMEVIENYVINTKKHILTSGSFIIGSLGIMHIDANSVYNFEYQPNIVEQKTNTTVQTAREEMATQNTQTVKVAQTVRPIQSIQSVQPVQAAKQPERVEMTERQPERAERQPDREERKPERVERLQEIAERQPEKVERQAERIEKQVVNESKEHQTIDVKGLQYQKPIRTITPGHNKKKTDMIMLIAIIAATIAIIAMGYGIYTSTSPELTLEPRNETQQTEADTTQAAPSK